MPDICLENLHLKFSQKHIPRFSCDVPRQIAVAAGVAILVALYKNRGPMLGFVDVIYTWYSWLIKPKGDRFFSDGFGEMDDMRDCQKKWSAIWRSGALRSKLCALPMEIKWEESGSPQNYADPDVVVEEGSFQSPLHEALPPECKIAFVQRVRGRPGGKFPTSHSTCIHFAATGDCSYDSRRNLLAIPLLAHGVESIILMVSYYGSRKPSKQHDKYIRTVADYQFQTLACVLEGCWLVHWLGRTCSHKIAVTGISWGGAMAAVTSTLCMEPVACVPCLGSDSAAVMVTGIINWQLDWDRLAKQCVDCDIEEARSRLHGIFSEVTLETLVQHLPSNDRTLGSLVQVSALSDYFVVPEEGEQLFGVLQARVRMGASVEKAEAQVNPHTTAELRWVKGGHASSFLSASELFVPAIKDALQYLG